MPTNNAVAPTTQPTEPAQKAGFGDLGNEENDGSDKPFDKEPFDAGVEADEESDPKKYIEQLTGKLGQSLRKYNEQNGQPDLELEKFAINSLISATHTSEMDDNDREDIINKVNTAGNNDKDSEVSGFDDSNNNTNNNNDNNIGGDDEFGDINQSIGNNDEEDLEEVKIIETQNLFLKEPVKCNMFQPGSNDVLKNSVNEGFNYSKKNSIFGKTKILNKLHESLNQDDMRELQPAEPEVKPEIKPDTTPVKPSRRNKPFLPMPEVQPDPKAMDENMNNFIK